MRTKLFLAIVVGLMTFGAHLALAQRPLGDSRVFATVPAVPGFPEGIASRGDRVYVSGPANFGIFTPSAAWAYDLRTGVLEKTFPITLQDPNPAAMKALSPGNFGPDGKLYAPEPFMGVVLRLHLDPGNTQDVYARSFPAPGGQVPPCSTNWSSTRPATSMSPTRSRPPSSASRQAAGRQSYGSRTAAWRAIHPCPSG